MTASVTGWWWGKKKIDENEENVVYFSFSRPALASLASLPMFLKRTERKIKQRLFTGQEVMGAGKHGARARDTRVSLVSLASPQTSFGVHLSRIHFSPKGRLWGGSNTTSKKINKEKKATCIIFMQSARI